MTYGRIPTSAPVSYETPQSSADLHRQSQRYSSSGGGEKMRSNCDLRRQSESAFSRLGHPSETGSSRCEADPSPSSARSRQLARSYSLPSGCSSSISSNEKCQLTRTVSCCLFDPSPSLFDAPGDDAAYCEMPPESVRAGLRRCWSSPAVLASADNDTGSSLPKSSRVDERNKDRRSPSVEDGRGDARKLFMTRDEGSLLSLFWAVERYFLLCVAILVNLLTVNCRREYTCTIIRSLIPGDKIK